ncbi:MAG TPA: Tat pathway signal protein [Acetobacteraceae bacterium]|nr:Tat pathway signal protein [Acetobacteraceae bacterium]
MRSAFFSAGGIFFVGFLLAGPLGPLCSPARAAATSSQTKPGPAPAAQASPGQTPPSGQAPSTAPAGTPISLELNKLTPLEQGPGCRAYFVVGNPGPEPIPELQLDLILFGTDGIISRRLAVELGPLPAQKTEVRLFDLTDTPCDSIGHILLNDVLSCQVGATPPGTPPGAPQGGGTGSDTRAACLARIAVSSRAKAQLTR